MSPPLLGEPLRASLLRGTRVVPRTLKGPSLALGTGLFAFNIFVEVGVINVQIG